MKIDAAILRLFQKGVDTLGICPRVLLRICLAIVAMSIAVGLTPDKSTSLLVLKVVAILSVVFALVSTYRIPKGAFLPRARSLVFYSFATLSVSILLLPTNSLSDNAGCLALYTISYLMSCRPPPPPKPVGKMKTI